MKNDSRKEYVVLAWCNSSCRKTILKRKYVVRLEQFIVCNSRKEIRKREKAPQEQFVCESDPQMDCVACLEQFTYEKRSSKSK